MSDRRLWTSDEDSIILKLVEVYGLKKWTTVADQMKKKFPSLARSSKQIRQRWYNHLDPEINKKPWTPKEEEILFEAHQKYGNKWKQIAKLLYSRTDNSAKNHFYSTLRRSLRRINKFLGFKNSTNQMKELKPSILSKLIESSDYNQESRTLVNGIFHFASVKPKKSKRKSEDYLEEDQKQFFRQAIDKIIQFNEKYGQNRQVLRKKKSKKSLTFMKIVDASPTLQQSEEEAPTSNSSEHFYKDTYEIEVSEKESWEESSQKNCGMLPDLQLPEEEDVICMEEQVQEFYHFDLKAERIFEQIEIGFNNN